MIVIPPAHAEATSVKWPQEGSLMRHSHPMDRHSHSRVDSNSSLGAYHRGVQHRARNIPGLPQGVPPGVSCLCQSYHTPSLQRGSYLALPAALNCTYTSESPQGKELAQPSPAGNHSKMPCKELMFTAELDYSMLTKKPSTEAGAV